MSYFRTLKDPTLYHGHGKDGDFFEGWYFKLVNADGSRRYAIIPGVFKHGDPHAFIQVMDGLTGDATYHRYPVDAFSASETAFDVRIADNHFRADCLILDIDDEQRTVSGEVRFENRVPYPWTWTSPGIMGPFGYLPFLECNHGVVSIDHTLTGTLTVDGETAQFYGGRGYAEKDWGSGFPSGYIWLQTNHFSSTPTGLMVSIAMIPRLGRPFRGFLSAFYHEGQLYRFATYTGARIRNLHLSDTHVRWHLIGRTGGASYRLEIDAERASGGILKAPYDGQMVERVAESLTAEVDVRLVRQERAREVVVFADRGQYAGLEVVGDLSPLLDSNATSA